MADAAMLVTRTTRDGRTLTVGVKDYLPGHPIAVAYLDGKLAASGTPLAVDAPGAFGGTPKLAAIKAQGVTHVLTNASRTVSIALFAAEAAPILAEIDRRRDAYAASPEGRAAGLRSEREALVAAVDGAIEDQADAYDRAHDRQDAAAEIIRREHQPAVDAARAALAAFDAAHPEVADAIRAERMARADRLIEAGL